MCANLNRAAHGYNRDVAKPDKKETPRLIAENRKARYEYAIGDTFEAGIQLVGTEVKSMRTGQVNIAESYASVENNGIFLINAYIPEYKGAGHFFQHEPKRPRRLLLHKREIAKFAGKAFEKGLTLVPLKLYFKRGKAKVAIGLGRGKKLYDKRADEKRRDDERDMQRAVRTR